jgi:para-aminobenzoate synthetase/4-amino-4-deoxychorismate lyase
MRVSVGEIYLLSRHLSRLASTAQHFGFVCDLGAIRELLIKGAVRQPDPSVARLLLSRSGEPELQFRLLPLRNPSILRVSLVKVDSSDEMLCHKTTARDIYEQARAGMPNDMDALLTNERGEITETTIANVAVKRGNSWITPRVSCGLLPGTMRAQLLDDGEIEEGLVRLEDLSAGEPFRCFNAVRGAWDALFV